MTQWIFFKRNAFPILLLAFVLLALAYSVIIPLGEAPDEVSHWSYVQYLLDNHWLPTGDGASSGEAHQAPLYYFLDALFTSWIPSHQITVLANPDWQLDNPQANNLLLHTRDEGFPYHDGALAWHLGRVLSILFSSITVWTTFQITRQVFPSHETLAITAAGFVAFLPQFIFLSAVVNNDNLVIALSALSLLVFLRTPPNAPSRRFILLGTLLGLGALTKISAFVLWGAIGIALLLRQENSPLRQRLRCIIVTFATSIALISPWCIYNWMIFGDPLNMTRWLNTVPRTEPMVLSDWTPYGVRMIESFWGKFGGASSLAMPQLAYVALSALLVVALMGVILLLNDWRAGKLPSATRQGLLTFSLYWLLLELAYLRSVYALLGMDQARQIFAGLPAFGALVTQGILRPFRRHYMPALILICGMGLVALANGFSLASLYAPNPTLTNVAASSPMDFGKQIRVVNFRVDPQRVLPGDTISVQVQWQALNDMSEDYWLLLQIKDRDQSVASKDGVPSAGRTTTDWWHQGQQFESRHTITIPEDALPGNYTLRLGLHPFGNWNWLQVDGQDMLELGKIEIN